MRDSFEQLRRIQGAIAKIAEYTRVGRDSFDKEEKVRLSIIYYLQVIVHAVYTIPQGFKDHYPEIPWKQITDIQKHLTPYYIEADHDAIWKIATLHIPALKPKVDAALEHQGRDGINNKGLYAVVREKKTTKDLRDLLQSNREAILHIAARYGASNVRIFGSVARGEADSESDIDFLVDMEPDRSLLDLSRLLTNLQSLLGYKLDIVTEQGLNDRIRERVLKEAVKL